MHTFRYRPALKLSRGGPCTCGCWFVLLIEEDELGLKANQELGPKLALGSSKYLFRLKIKLTVTCTHWTTLCKIVRGHVSNSAPPSYDLWKYRPIMYAWPGANEGFQMLEKSGL
jgi:hypothetical protein